MCPDMEAVMTKEPVPRDLKCAPTALAQWKVPLRSVWMTSFQASTEPSRIPGEEWVSLCPAPG